MLKGDEKGPSSELNYTAPEGQNGCVGRCPGVLVSAAAAQPRGSSDLPRRQELFISKESVISWQQETAMELESRQFREVHSSWIFGPDGPFNRLPEAELLALLELPSARSSHRNSCRCCCWLNVSG